MMSAAVDGGVTARVEVDEVDEQLTTLNTDEATPMPDRFITAVSRTNRKITSLNIFTALTHIRSAVNYSK